MVNMANKKITIEWVEANGFRANKEPVRFEFGSENHISGGNGKGKSSIGEAIVFGVTGCDKEGKSNAADRLMNLDCDEMSISVGIRVGKDVHRIDRYVVKHKNKTETTIHLNNNKTNQETIDALVVNRKHFLAAFLLDYFCLLEAKEAREQMVSLLPVPTDSVVLTALEEENTAHANALKGAALTDPDIFISKEKEQLQGFKDELLRLEGETRSVADTLKMETPEKVEIDYKPIQALKESIGLIERAIPSPKDTSALSSKLTKLQAEYEAIQKNLSFEENIVICENCGHPNNLSAEQDTKNAEITTRMGEINLECSVIVKEIKVIQVSNTTLFTNFEKANGETLHALREQLKEMEVNLSLVERQNMNVDVLLSNREKAKERSLVIQTEQANLMKYIENADLRIKAAQAFKVKKSELQVDGIKKSLKRVSIRLYNVTKSTGEVKPTFALNFDGKEYRVLSTSEKARCGLEISRLICKLSKQDLPVFLDNYESITHFEKPTGQLFTAEVCKNADLNLEVVS